MAIIYSYPNELSIQATDILIGTTTKIISGKRKNQTRNFSMEGISEFVINNIPRGTLTKANDTNVTLTLGGTPVDSLFNDVSITVGWTGLLADNRIASAAYWNAKQDSITLTTIGSTGAATFVADTLNIPDYSLSIPVITPSALTRVNDTNVTLTLGGTPNTSLLQGVSLTLGWSGTLADSRIASASTWNAKQDAITLTTTGTSGAATLVGSTLNIPQYSGGGVSYTFTSPLVDTAGTVTINQSSSTVNGYLSSTDWGIFNGKQNALSGTGLVKSTSGTISYITDNSTNWDTAYTNRITSLTTTGTGAATLISNVLNIPTPPTATFTSLTTSGSSGLSTLIGGVLNVPGYTLAGLGGVPTSRTLTINGTAYDLTADRTWSVGTITGVTATGPITSSGGTTPIISTSMATNKLIGRSTAGTGIMEEITIGTGLSLSAGTLSSANSGTVTSVGLTMPAAFTVSNSPITGAGTIAVTGAGTASQYIRGDGALATYNPGGGGGGASVSYYLNGSVSQGTIGGVAYEEMNMVPVIGTGTDFTINADGYIAQFITDAGDPNKLLIPAGNWNFETYFNASSGGGSPSFYVELYKYDGTTFTLIASSSASPELITGGTSIDLYFTALAIPATTLLVTDRLAVRFYVTHSGRTITMHTENSNLCQVITTFSTGLTALNGLTTQVQNFATGTSGSDFNISSITDTHTFNLPTASASNRGALSSTDWSTFNGKQNTITLTTTGTGAATFVSNTLNIPTPPAATFTSLTITGSSGASTLIGGVLNVPEYTLSGLGGVPTTRNISTTSPLQGGGDLSADRTLSILQSSASQNGYLSSTDWSAFNGKFTLPSLTSGSVLFSNGTTIAQDNANFFWDDTNNRLGIGTSGPAKALEVSASDAIIHGVTIGRGAGDQASNTVIGQSAFTSNSTGSNNTVLGASSGKYIEGDRNTFIGADAFKNPLGDNFIGGDTLSIAKNSADVKGYPHFWAPITGVANDGGSDAPLALSASIYSGFFTDYVIQEDSANNIMQSGTIRAIFNSDGSIITWSNDNILSMGDTSGITFNVEWNGTEIKLNVFNDLGNTYPINVNTTSRLILRKPLT